MRTLPAFRHDELRVRYEDLSVALVEPARRQILGDYKPGDLRLRHSYRLVVKSTSGLKDYEVHEQMEYQGDMEVWFPDAGTNTVGPRPVFINRAIPRLISVAYEDILEAELH